MGDNLVKEFDNLNNERKMLQFLRQYLIAKNFRDALLCLEFALDVHKDQKRDDGKPYIVHPLAIVVHGICIGLDKAPYLNPEVFIGTGLDHDTIEDHPERVKEFDSLSICSDIKHCVHTLDKTPYRRKYPKNKALADDEYYQGIGQSLMSSLIKLEDRYHNFSTMKDAFDLNRKIKYINEFYLRYPKLMEQIEQEIAISFSQTQSYYILKQELFGLAQTHEKSILRDISNLQVEDKNKLLQELGNSRKRLIA